MKKRAIEALGALALMAAVFICVNMLTGSAERNFRRIDGEYYNIGERQLTLALITEEGTEQLAEFSRLESLTVQPYKYAAADSLDMNSAEYNKELRKQADKLYADYTSLSELDFLAPLTWIKSLDISLCTVSELSFTEGMTSLENLNISHTLVTDLSALAGSGSVKTLTMNDIPADDISPLLKMTALERVCLDRRLEGEITEKLAAGGVEIVFPEAKA